MIITEYDTICAIATGMTNSGISIIRISGPQSIEIADCIFHGIKNDRKLRESASHTVHYGKIIDSAGRQIDEVLAVVMKAPNTYTREDVVEINCHGGVYVTKRVLEEVIKAGARPAQPGEFTKRAFLNGRIDLTQAEAVADVINSKNKHALAGSIGMLSGKLSKIIVEIRENLLENIAYIEAALDDPEHISMENFVEKLKSSVENYINQVEKLLKTYENGKLFTEGVKTAIIGKPNAGKSSVLNLISGYERAIVTDIAGTTRDTVEESINLEGITLNLVDTAGIRDTQDVVEKIGINKAKEAAEKADLILVVIDSSEKLDENDTEILNMSRDKKKIILLNKSDLNSVVTAEDIKKFTSSPVIIFSAKSGEGLNELSDLIVSLFSNGELEYNDEIYISDARKKSALDNALESFRLVLEGIDAKMSEDLLNIDLLNAYEWLGKIIGETLEDDVANEIFSKFCMGK